MGGLRYTCEPAAEMGKRISDLRLNDQPLSSGRTYKVAGWASVAENVEGRPIWEVVADYLRAKRSLTPPVLNLPTLRGIEGNPGIS